MIRTLIVDDDSLIHVTLRSMIDWERYGYTVVQDCSGGDQVLHYLREHSIDLLLTDMKMPGMGGLELLRRLRQSSSMPVTVVLSGYDEFDLVREAFRLGAYDYLLKANISPAGLAQLLNGLRSKVFRGIPAGGDAPSDSLRLEPGDYAVAVFRVRHFARDAQRFGGNLRERLEKPMVELVQQIRRLQGRAWLRAKDPSCYLLYYRVQNRGSIRDTILSVVRQIQGVWRDFMNLETSAGVSDVVSESGLPEAVERCELLCRLSALKGSVCTAWQDFALAEAYVQQKEDCGKLLTALFQGNPAQRERVAESWMTGLSSLPEQTQIDRALILLAYTGDRLGSYGLELSDIFPGQENFADFLRGFDTPKERTLWLRGALRRIEEAGHAQGQQKSEMQRAREFLQDNFSNPELTLKTVADYVGFNEKYFSTRFAKECGSTFIAYLNDLRIAKAQELLLQTDLKMYEISEAVGYRSVEHFNHMFKKKLCISPRDYRQGRKNP